MARLVWICLAWALLALPAHARPSGAALAECRDESELLSLEDKDELASLLSWAHSGASSGPMTRTSATSS